MTKKKRKRKEERRASQQGIERSHRAPEEFPDLSALPDPRAMERMTAEIGRLLDEQDFDSMEEAQAFLDQILLEGRGFLPDAPAPTTPLGKAQNLMYEAFETESPRERIQLARRALKTSEDCADAYVLLAEEDAGSLEEARDLYQRGVEAGERALGEETFKEEKGDFWGILETRPYMRARQGLATCLWQFGERAEAIEHYRKMLELNPNDNQGIRYELADALLDEGLDEELGMLLEQYEEEASASWLYTRALREFREEGATEETAATLEEAMEANPHVPLYLLGRKSLSAEVLPQLIGFGDESEAVSYFMKSVSHWLKTPRAVEWLRENADEQSLVDPDVE